MKTLKKKIKILLLIKINKKIQLLIIQKKYNNNDIIKI